MPAWDARFEKLLTEVLHLDDSTEITGSLDMVAMGLDSLRMIRLLNLVEETYEFSFSQEALDVWSFRTPNVLWSAIEQSRRRELGTTPPA